jgi:predicted DNA-binding WGR domain protein
LKEYLEFVGADVQKNTADSKKFWEIEVVGKSVFTRFGRIGSDGTKIVKEFQDDETARQFAKKTLAEKLRKGYSKGKTGQPKGDKVGLKEVKLLSLNFEYLISFSWYYEESQPYEEVPLTLEQKREKRASDFVRDQIDKGIRPKVDILSKGKVIATIDSSEVEYTQDVFQSEPSQDVRYFSTGHALSGKTADLLQELVDRYEVDYDKGVLQAKVKIGNYTFLHHKYLWESVWEATKKEEFSKFENNCTILANMWFAMQDDEKYKEFRDLNEISSPFDYRDDEEFRDLLEDHRPGLMAAYLVDVGHIEASKSSTALIESTYNSIAKFLGVPSKKAFETFQEMIEDGK